MIYLASRSPRRLELLKQIGITEVRLLLDEDEGRAEELEAIRPKESPTNYVERVARAKAEAAWQRLQELQRQDFLAQMAGSPVAEIAATGPRHSYGGGRHLERHRRFGQSVCHSRHWGIPRHPTCPRQAAQGRSRDRPQLACRPTAGRRHHGRRGRPHPGQAHG